MTYKQRLSFFIIIDSATVLLSIFFSTVIIHAELTIFTPSILSAVFIILLCHYVLAFYYKLYNKLWEYASIGEMVIIFKVVTLSIVMALTIQFLLYQDPTFRLLLVTWLLHMFLIGGSRFLFRLYRDSKLQKVDRKVRTLIVGAGSAGTMVARQLLKKNEQHLLPVAFIDDDPYKHQMYILGIPVVGGINDIKQAVEQLNIENIIISIPSLEQKRLNQIYQECAKTNVKTRILPLLEDLITGKVSVNQFRDVEPEDLLGREPINLDMEEIAKVVTNKVVLVTGAGGSIGSEISRQIAHFQPRQLILLGHGENSIYTIAQELKEQREFDCIDIVTEIADIQDKKKINQLMSLYEPNIVYHAAAHKHVPLMEKNPEEAVKNNMIGTLNVAEAASVHHVDSFVMLSTDKAVNPTSVMGATKRLAEMLIQHLDQVSSTKFVAVRFGNVLGSRGSVIPLFKRQIAKGGPVTITDPNMVRYFMTIPEASRLVIQAGVLAKGGEILVLDMGEPIKIVEIAKNLIRLSGHRIDDIGIKYTGIRPGEKLFEELLQKDEIHHEQVFPKIYIGKTTNIYLEEIEQIIDTYVSLPKEVLRERLLDLANGRSKQTVDSLLSG